MAAAFGAVALIAVAFVALRPEDGQAADGSERQTPTTTTEAVIESTEDVTTTVPPPLVAEVIDLEGTIREVVSAPIGYLAVLEGAAPRGEPPVLRSIDGVDWTTVDAEVVETNEFDLRRSRFAGFVGLQTTDAGDFTVLRVRQQLAEPGRTGTGFFIVDRIASQDGVSWSVDTAFEDVLVRQAIPFTTAEGTLLLSSFGPLPETPQTLVSADEEILSALASLDCSPRGSSIDLLLLEDCDNPAEPTTSEPEPVDEATCRSQYLEDVSQVTQPSEFVIIEAGGTTQTFSAVGLASAPQELGESGVIAALVHAIPEAPSECPPEDLDFPAGRPLGLQIFSGPEGLDFVPVTNFEAADFEPDELAEGVSLGSVGNDLLIAASDAFFRINPRGLVSRVASVDGLDLMEGVPTSRSIEGGTEVIDVRDGQLRRFVLSDDLLDMSEEPVFEQAGFLEVRYIDDDVIVTFSPAGDRAIRLPG